MRTIAALTMLLLGACAPSVIGSNERGIVVGSINSVNEKDAFALADKHCRQLGRVARMSTYDVWAGQASYDCVQ